MPLCGAIEKRQSVVHRDPARPKNQHDQRGDEKREGSGGNKLVRIGKEREQRLPVPDDVSHGHVNGEDESCDSGKQTQSEEDAAKQFDASNEERPMRGHWQAKAAEKLRHIGQVMELAPAALRKLTSTVEPH